MSLKATLRADIKACLKDISQSDILAQTSALKQHLTTLPEFQHAHGVSIYLSMKGEIHTYDIIKSLIETHSKQIYIPKIIGKAAKDMIMLPLVAYKEIDAFPKNIWGIPEPEIPFDHELEQHFANIGIVIMPGVAFDRTGGRLGHGKGYYDCFTERLCNARKAAGKSAPCLVGLALKQQILAQVPIEAHDRYEHPHSRLGAAIVSDVLLG
jgi:5-formyltetrahydrofolate cyclo-ligase